MPELPEVESVVRSLRPRLVGARIIDVETSGFSLRRPVERKQLLRACRTASVEKVRRVGKYLLLELSTEFVLVAHLGMTGRLVFASADEPRAPHTHVVFLLEGGGELRYVDARRFGVLVVYPTKELETAAELRALGPDPLSHAFTQDYLSSELKASRQNLKSFLMDQGRIAGLGNIYVCEALFRAQLSPRRRAHRVTAVASQHLRTIILQVLDEAVRNRGTSFSDYVDANGERGDNQNSLFVYAREGQACRVCRTKIRRLVQGARSTFYCPTCQK